MRRVLLDIFGEERFLHAAGAVRVHKDNYGQLFKQELANDEPLRMVRVRNSTREPDGT
ncbi:MAG: hypothetical protein K2Z81_02345 [Cyanobacteria bacterium]|nr:hypothetical protein [Cyanobacteriota bacterium]